jgi:beta-lactamase class A
MRGCKRGQLRLLGLLPHKTPVAHKTGTLTGFACDVGIITLPNEAGSIAISVFIKESNKELEHLERIIAEVGRTIYDYFLFN